MPIRETRPGKGMMRMGQTQNAPQANQVQELVMKLDECCATLKAQGANQAQVDQLEGFKNQLDSYQKVQAGQSPSGAPAGALEDWFGKFYQLAIWLHALLHSLNIPIVTGKGKGKESSSKDTSGQEEDKEE